MINIHIKDTVRRLEEYVVPRDFSRVKLNQNESPFDIPMELKQEISGRLPGIPWNRYPDNYGEGLTGKLARYLDFPTGGIIVGNSSNELCQAVIYSVCDSGDTIVTVNPGFPIYNRVAAVMNVKVREVPLDVEFRFDVGAVVKASEGARLVFLASPNNPTGTALTVKEIGFIAGNIDGFLAVDEAYYEFYRQTARELIKTHKNIIIIRTFSKAFQLADIRLGYMLGDEKIIREVAKAKLPFSVGLFQQLTGEIILENREFVTDNVAKIVLERERVSVALNKIPHITPVPSFTNFILFRSGKIAGRELYEALYDRGVVVRYFDTPRLENCLRVTIGTPEENNFFLEKLEQVMCVPGEWQ